MQLSHVLRQANAGVQMPWRDEAFEVMAEHLGGVALEQYREEMQALEARERALAEAKAEHEELARL